MNLIEFAKQSGVTVFKTEDGFCYKESSYPNITTSGFKTEKAAYKHWLKDTFNDKEKPFQILLKLAKKNKLIDFSI